MAGLRLVKVVGPLTVNGACPTGREYPGSTARTPVATGSPGGTTAWISFAETKVCDVAGTPLKETVIRCVKCEPVMVTTWPKVPTVISSGITCVITGVGGSIPP